jgi:hypothetical protein
MGERPRIDLDGVDLHDPRNDKMALAVFRYRTTQGLILLVPESAEVLVEWKNIRGARVDLQTGNVAIDLDESYVAGENWLRGATTLVGKWIDRFTLDESVLGAL